MGYRRLSDSTKKKIVREFYESGQSNRNFCESRGISSSALYRWQKLFPDTKQPQINHATPTNIASEVDFVEVSEQVGLETPINPKVVRIVTSYGATVEITL